ncbi:MAG: aminodeoxychorismate lyase, partial [Micrococcales bacterium]|nr:aminodeoxychorismate lyase [Micrococcales bacterium]
MSAKPILLVLDLTPDGTVRGHRAADPESPLLRAPDLAATRGDGVFETVSIGYGHPQALEAHLTRLARSARMLDLPAPDLGGWRAVVVEAGAHMSGLPESWVKIVYSRGVEGGGSPTGWAWGQATPDHTAARTDGIRVALLDRGWSSAVAQTAPWLLAG